MDTPRRNLLSLALIGAVTAGGGFALTQAEGASATSAKPGAATSRPVADVQTTELQRQLNHLLGQDQGLQDALRRARHNLAARVHAENLAMARQRLAESRQVTPPQSAPSAPPTSRPAPTPTHSVAPSPTPSTHGSTGASGGSGQGGGGDDGHGGGGDDGGGGDGGGDD